MVMLPLLWSIACSPPSAPDWEPHSLAPYPNHFVEDERYRPQPHRENPFRVVADHHGGVWVTLQGSADEPGKAVVRVDTESGKTTRVNTFGSGPTGMALHPDGRWLVVFNRFSNYATVVDTWMSSVAHLIHIDYYTGDGVFSPDGRELWVTNRWHDAVGVVEIEATATGLLVEEPFWIDAPINPRDIAISADGHQIAVGTAAGLEASIIDRESRIEEHRLQVGSPTNDIAFVGEFLYIATLSAGTHHPMDRGPDTDGDGNPGDGTPNNNFADVQNELAIYRRINGQAVHRYTSDTICCYEGGDISPDDPLGPLLPPMEDWIVGGAMPEQFAVAEIDGESWLYVTYSASNEFQRFKIDATTGTLTAGPVSTTTGHNPFGIAITGSSVFIANRLSESLGEYSVATGATISEVFVGDVSDGLFPLTQAENGELTFFVTPLFGEEDDGDRACAHCHRENSTLDRPISLTNATYPGMGSRMNVPLHGEYDTLPWLWEASADEEKFRLGSGPPNGGNPPPDPHLRASQGGGDEGTLGLYLITEPMYLPNPNSPDSVEAQRGKAIFERNDVGCATCHPAPTFTASTTNNPFNVPFRMGPVVSPVRGPDGANFDLLDTQFLINFPETEQDRCSDVCPPAVCNNDARACDHLRTVRFGAPSLRGIWDHPPRMLHHGMAIGLREVLCTPGHPALEVGEVGFNELDGQFDSHGGTSHLSPTDIDDLIAYLLTL